MPAKYKSAALESVGLALPQTVVTSSEIERRLAPLYQRLGLPEGRLELMTGIRERRFASPGCKPSDLAIEAGEKALAQSTVPREQIGCLIHSSVCRDFVEPATASVVHHALGLSRACQIFDLSNACLGWVNAISQVANMIELGQIRAGLVVSGEDGRALVESTIEQLNRDTTLTRKTIKASIASLTIGSGGVAAVIASNTAAPHGHRILAAESVTASEHHTLCQGGVDPGQSTATHVTMQTDSSAMLQAGVALAAETWARTRNLLGWQPGTVDQIITHQVGRAHSQLLFERLELDPARAFDSYQTLGNIGSASIGATLALAEQAGRLSADDQVLLMGIGSGLVSMMIGLRW